MYPSKILVLPASPHSPSPDSRLAALAAKELTLADVEATRISLADYPLPLCDPGFEALSGPPHQAMKLAQMIGAHEAVFIATSEICALPPPHLINALAWVARVRDRAGEAGFALRGRAFAIAAVARESDGGVHALSALRQMLALGCGALVLPQQLALAPGDNAFDDRDNLRNASQAEALRDMLRALVSMARKVEGRH